jgi:hypothetical protein
MTTKILIEFDPKDASPLEVISTLEKMMQSNLEEGKVSDYSIAEQFEQSDISVFTIELVARKEPQAEPKQETPT